MHFVFRNDVLSHLWFRATVRQDVSSDTKLIDLHLLTMHVVADPTHASHICTSTIKSLLIHRSLLPLLFSIARLWALISILNFVKRVLILLASERRSASRIGLCFWMRTGRPSLSGFRRVSESRNLTTNRSLLDWDRQTPYLNHASFYDLNIQILPRFRFEKFISSRAILCQCWALK